MKQNEHGGGGGGSDETTISTTSRPEDGSVRVKFWIAEQEFAKVQWIANEMLRIVRSYEVVQWIANEMLRIVRSYEAVQWIANEMLRIARSNGTFILATETEDEKHAIKLLHCQCEV